MRPPLRLLAASMLTILLITPAWPAGADEDGAVGAPAADTSTPDVLPPPEEAASSEVDEPTEPLPAEPSSDPGTEPETSSELKATEPLPLLPTTPKLAHALVAALADPVINDDEYTTPIGTDLVITAPGPLANDTGGPFTYWGILAPSNGAITYSDDAGSFTYRPDPDFVGTDTFTYFAFIGGTGYGPATVTIHVVPPNQTPITANDHYSVVSGESLVVAAPGFRANDSDPDGDDFTGQVVTVFGHALSHSFNGTTGALEYVPEPGFVGTDTLTYHVTDVHGGVSNVAEITVDVAPPVDPDDDGANDPSDDGAESSGVLPDTGGPSWWIIALASSLTASGALILRRSRLAV